MVTTMDYIIQINIKPEIFNGYAHYFWFIINNNTNPPSNCGHGWASSVVNAATDAELYYQKVLKSY